MNRAWGTEPYFAAGFAGIEASLAELGHSGHAEGIAAGENRRSTIPRSVVLIGP